VLASAELRVLAGGVGPSKTATQCKSLVFQSTIFAIRVRGTESKAPIGPSSQPHTNIDTSTIRGETLSDRPRALGSMRLPMMKLKTAKPPATMPARPGPYAVNAMKIGGMAATSPPTVGT